MSFRVILFKKTRRCAPRRGLLGGRGRATAALLARLAVPVLVAAPLLGCVLPDTSKPSACQQLRAVDVGALPDPLLEPDQQARRDEVCQYVLQDQQAAGWQVVFTSQTPLGQIWDWVDATTVQGADVQPPVTLTLAEIQALLPESAQLTHMELEDYPDLQGPAGTIPFLRPDFSAYVAGGTGATSLDDWLNNYQVSGSPSNPDRLYAGVLSVVDNAGASVNINEYGGFIESGTMTCHEMLVGCRVNGVMWQQIGIASIRDSANADILYVHKADSLLRLGVEFLSAGPDSGNKTTFGWDRVTNTGAFLAPPFRTYSPGAFFSTSTISTVGGVQYESFYQIKVKDGDWWVGINDHWLGHYPAKLFAAGPAPNLATLKACEMDTYGEVYDSTPASWTTTPMGSGHFASEGWPNAAYFRNLTYFSDPAAAPVAPPANVMVDVPGSNDACYTKTPLTLGAAPWNSFFYADGPGGAAQGCTGPLP